MNVKAQSKNQAVYETIRDAIVYGEFQPGARIVIDELAEKLQVSHSPIREVLRQLEADGFVTIKPYAGVTVTELPASFITEVFAILEAMEVISSTRACTRMTEQDFDELEAFVAEIGNHLDDPYAWSSRNVELHLLICDYAETSIVKDTMQRTLRHWFRLRHHYLKDVSRKRIPTAHAEHVEIIQAMRQRDVELVEQIIRRHNRSALAYHLEHIEQEVLNE
ncbi:MAG: GntR family transcriptional regulator [Chloroflexota bacterium]